MYHMVVDLSHHDLCAKRESVRNLKIHLNNNFDDDRVKIEVDDSVIFNEEVTTDYIVSFAEIIRLQRPMDTHRIKVVVNGKHAGKNFDLDRELFIHIRYYREPIPEHNISKG